MGALSNGGKRRKGGNLSALRSDHDDGVRSDRRGGVPITSVAIRAVLKRLAPRARLSIVARAESGPPMGRRYDCSRPPSSWIPCALPGRSPDTLVRLRPLRKVDNRAVQHADRGLHEEISDGGSRKP